MATQRLKLTTATAAFLLAAGALSAQEVEMLHWWTSGGEAAALTAIKDAMAAQGVGWKDMPVAGGGGEAAMTTLRARVTSGNPPTAVQVLGFDITDWAEQGVVSNLSDVALAGNWADLVPLALQQFSKYEGNWIAAPVDLHSTNWVWANAALLKELGVAQPTTWDEFVAAMEAVEASGRIALAHGGQAWQEATMFDGVVLSTGGPDFYRRAFIDLDPEALGSETMIEAFRRMETLRSFVDDNFSGRDWNLASAMVINGEAAFQIMGDWAKGEFINAGLIPGEDILCFRVPGTDGAVTFLADHFVMFEQSDAAAQHAQKLLAATTMSVETQMAFNMLKGAVPARTDVPMDRFDACAQAGMEDVAEADAAGTLLGSMAHGHANRAAVKNAIYDVLTAHFNGEFDAATAAEELVSAVAASM